MLFFDKIKSKSANEKNSEVGEEMKKWVKFNTK